MSQDLSSAAVVIGALMVNNVIMFITTSRVYGKYLRKQMHFKYFEIKIIKKILHSCSYSIECIKLVGKSDYMLFNTAFISFLISCNKLNQA